MTMIALKGRLSLDDLQGSWEKSRETLVSSLGDLQDGVVAAVNGGLSSENTTSGYDDCVLTHNTPARIKNPLSVPCQGIYAVRCVGMEMSGGKPTRKLYSLETPQIDWEPADTSDNLLSVTARYPAPVGACAIYRSAAHSLANNANTVVPMDTSLFASGALSFDTTNTGILCTRAGYVQANGELEFSASALGTQRKVFIAKPGVTEIWGSVRNDPPASTWGAAGGGLVEVSAGDILQLFGFQDSGGTLALTVAQRRCKIDAHYVAPASTTTGKVTLFFFGG